MLLIGTLAAASLVGCNDGGSGGTGSTNPVVMAQRNHPAPPAAFAPAPLNARIIPLGATRAGATRLIDLAPRYVFEYDGDERIRYAIDTGHPDVAAGLLRIEEETTGSLPLFDAGLLYRDAQGVTQSPRWFRTNSGSTLATEVDGETLRLNYTGTLDGGTSHVYEIKLAGKSLEVRAYDAQQEVSGTAAFAGLAFGAHGSLGAPQDLRVPFMISTPVTKFQDPSGEGAFLAVQPDAARSNSGRLRLKEYDGVTVTSDSIDSAPEILYPLHSRGDMNAPVDETFFLTVSRKIEDTFTETEATPSPYRDLLAGRTTALFSRIQANWADKKAHVEQLKSFGMDQMAVYDFFWWSESTQSFGPGSTAQPQTHIWAPAVDEPGCITFSETAKQIGFMHALYTLQGMNEDQPFHVSSDSVRNWQQADLLRISPTRAMSHSLREDTKIRERYGTTFAFYDVWGHEHPYVATDFDADVPDKAKTVGETLAQKRAFYRQMQEIHAGPVLSEGSGAENRVKRQFELLSAGFCDSVQASITTGAEADLEDIPADDPLLPENWWVMPDYSLRVLNRTQVNHGMGFYDRFLRVLQTPLSSGRLDRYRLYEITYGHSSFFQTTGPINGVEPGQLNNRLYFGSMIKEYYMMQALQREYLTAPIDAIEYLDGGTYRTASDILRNSTNPGGALEDLRDPRIRLTYGNGLRIWLNHGEAPWEGINAAGRTFTIPGDGFVASHPATGLLAFSAIPTAPQALSTPTRIDYALAPGWYEMFDGRGSVEGYGDISTPQGINGLAVKNLASGVELHEEADRSIVTSDSPAPALESIAILGQRMMAPGQRTLLRPIGIYGGGVEQEFSHVLGTWESSAPSVIAVNSGGVITASAPGQATIRFRTGDGVSGSVVVAVQ